MRPRTSDRPVHRRDIARTEQVRLVMTGGVVACDDSSAAGTGDGG